MKLWSTKSARRISVTAVAGVAAATLLTGCGFETRQQAAAVVNGHVIHEDDVQKTAGQLSAAKYEFPESVVVTALIAAPLMHAAVEKSGSWQSDATYAQVISTIPDATDTTKDFVATVALIQSQKLTEADLAAYRTDLDKAAISVNPKYGSLAKSAEDAPVYFRLSATTPNWITPFVDSSLR